MRFERKGDPKEAMGIGLKEQILKYFKAHLYTELRNPGVLNQVFRKIEADLGIGLQNLCPPSQNHYIIKVSVMGTSIIIFYEFDVPF